MCQQTLSPDMARPFVPIQRWYDRDAQLSNLVRLLEMLSPESQTLFGHLLKNSIGLLIKTRGREFYRGLNWLTFVGILKSKRSLRWYDREPALHTAFNMLFSLSEADKAMIGQEFHAFAELVLVYENYAKSKQIEIYPEMVYGILETCISNGPDEANEIYSLFH